MRTTAVSGDFYTTLEGRRDLIITPIRTIWVPFDALYAGLSITGEGTTVLIKSS